MPGNTDCRLYCIKCVLIAHESRKLQMNYVLHANCVIPLQHVAIPHFQKTIALHLAETMFFCNQNYKKWFLQSELQKKGTGVGKSHCNAYL